MKHWTDTFQDKGMRKKLIDQIRDKGISDERVLEAMNKIPRHYFLDGAFKSKAYEDNAFRIGSGQTISQPYTVAFQTMLLEVEQNHKVLEIGTGSGYQACILGELAGAVYTIERHKPLFEKAKKIIRYLGYKNIRTFFGDGYRGLPAFSPFDSILITAAAPGVPETLMAQLKTGGYMVVPVGKGEVQTMQRIKKISETEIESEDFGAFAFVPMLKGKVG
jgi:protein-L-isoaspartate(D-aspartate) O-methyltransferase